jgi:hypothetical protein
MTKAIIVTAAMLMAWPAAAGKIVCNDEYQVVNGREINTPYCADKYLAKVARESGFNVTFRQIRRQPELKDEICRHIGGDIRIQFNCAGYMDEDNGRR